MCVLSCGLLLYAAICLICVCIVFVCGVMLVVVCLL